MQTRFRIPLRARGSRRSLALVSERTTQAEEYLDEADEGR